MRTRQKSVCADSCMAAGLEVSGQLLHKDDVFVHVSHRDGYEGPMPVEEEGFLAGSPLVCILLSQTATGM